MDEKILQFGNVEYLLTIGKVKLQFQLQTDTVCEC